MSMVVNAELNSGDTIENWAMDADNVQGKGIEYPQQILKTRKFTQKYTNQGFPSPPNGCDYQKRWVTFISHVMPMTLEWSTFSWILVYANENWTHVGFLFHLQ